MFFSVISSLDDVKNLTPCCIEIPREIFWDKGVSLQVADFCQTVYIIFPQYFALSDAFKLPMLVGEKLPKNKEYIFIGADLSDKAIELIEKQLGNVRL